MPKKTRNEKIIADLRRKIYTNPTPSTSTPSQTLPKSFQTAYNIPSIGVTQSKINSLPVTSIPVSAIKKDLTKTFGLTILAISFEFMLYWLWAR